MSYLAIARKYRPATFDEIVGQEHVTRTLKNALRQNRIHHAFLFSGARGVGKTTAARALARALNCVQGPTPEPCGVCTSCTEVTGGNSPDLIEIDGASNNSVDDIRDLRDTVRYAPTRGKWKIYLIDEVHMLSKGAFNALLKTLEEPPAHVVFIFATTESNKIPETILSRVQRFDFKRISVVGVSERLREIATAEGVTVSDAALRMISRAGDGSMRDAQSLLDQVISYGARDAARVVTDSDVVEALGLIDRGLLYDMLGGLIAGTPDRCLEVIDRVYGYGYELSEFTAEMLEVLRNATFARLSPGSRKYIDVAPDELERIDGLTKDVDPEVLGRTFTAMLDVHDQVSRAPRPRVVLEMAVARLATTRPVHPVGALLGRLEDLERKLRQGGGNAPIGGMRTPRTPRGPRAMKPAADDEGAPAASAPVAQMSGHGGPPPRAPAPKPSNPAQKAQNVVPEPVGRASVPAAPQRGSQAPPQQAAPPKPAPQAPPQQVTPPVPPAPRPPQLFPSAVIDSTVPAATAAAAAAPVVTDPRYAAFLHALHEHKIAWFDGGLPSWHEDGRLRIELTGIALGEARRIAKGPEVAEALRRGYPGSTALEVLAPVGGVRSEDLAREVRRDLQRVIEKLGAEVGRVVPLAESES